MKDRNSKSRMIIGSIATPAIVLLVCWIYWSKNPSQPGHSTHLSRQSSKTGAADQRLSSNVPAQNSRLIPVESTSGVGATATMVEIPLKDHGNAGRNASHESTESGSTGALSSSPARLVRETALSPTCFEVAYHHKPLAGHTTDDDCSHHRNLIRIPTTGANLSSVCIRVNNTPVRHQLVAGTTDQFIIGPVAGPHDVITARFCVGKARCNQGCAYPAREPVKRDEFLDAIGASDDETGSDPGQWEAADAGRNAEVRKALSATDSEMRKEIEGSQESAQGSQKAGQKARTKLAIFRDWLGDPEQPACARASASHGSARRALADAH